MKFGDILKTLRNEKGVSIKKMAMDLDLNYTYISKIENAKSIPSANTIKRLSKYFNYDEDELALAAGKLPEEIQTYLSKNPKEALKYLRALLANN